MKNQENFSKKTIKNSSHCFQGRHPVRFLVIFLTLFIAVLVVSNIVGIKNKIKEGKYIGQDIESKNTITASATGEIYAKPDLALINFSVITEAETVAGALRENAEKMNSVISAVKNQGVEEKDLKTTSFNIYPRYEYRKVEEELYPYPPGKRVLVGYEVRQSLQIKIRNLEKIGDIIQTAADEGANQAGSLNLTIDNEDELKKQAREQAIVEAKEKAEEIASQLDVDLVRIVNFTESASFPGFYGFDIAAPEASLGKGGGLDIETGENKISVSVSITYEIN